MTTLNPSPSKCPTTLGASADAIGADGGASSVSVTTQPECAWTASADASWISDLTPTSGQGSGIIRFTAAKNPDGVLREGGIVVNDQRVAVRQQATCRIVITPATVSFSASGGAVQVDVSAPESCAWSIQEEVSWISVGSAPAAGPAKVTLTAATNSGGSRAAAVTIGGQAVTATQAGVPSSPPLPPPSAGPGPAPEPPAPPDSGVPLPPAQACTFGLSSTAASVGTGAGSTSVAVTTAATCGWAIASGASWITVGGAATRSGPGSVSLSFAVNTGAARVGTATIAGQTFTISQAGTCSVTLTPPTQTLGGSAGPGTAIGISTAAGCPWSATPGATWITLGSPTSGTGAGQITFTVTANQGAQRQSTINVGSQSVTVIQLSGCSYALDPVSVNVGRNGDKDVRVELTATGGCDWTAATPNDWITIKNPTSGSGSATIRFEVEKNNGAPRTGQITIGGIVVTVNQQ